KGDKIRSFWILQTLAREHQVDLFCFYDDPQDQQYIGKLQELCGIVYAESLKPVSARFGALAALVSGRPFTLGYFYSDSMRRRVAEALENKKYDLIFTYCSSMAQYVPRTTVP